jgi:hypothetical protein
MLTDQACDFFRSFEDGERRIKRGFGEFAKSPSQSVLSSSEVAVQFRLVGRSGLLASSALEFAQAMQVPLHHGGRPVRIWVNGHGKNGEKWLGSMLFRTARVKSLDQ